MSETTKSTGAGKGGKYRFVVKSVWDKNHDEIVWNHREKKTEEIVKWVPPQRKFDSEQKNS